MNVNVYIDGFNLFHGALKGTKYKWLDVKRLVMAYLPATATIGKINFFTATVSERAHDPGQSVRQEVYLRALRTIPEVRVIKGSFAVRPKLLPAATRYGRRQRVRVSLLGIPVRLQLASTKPDEKPQMLLVMKSEEKGSDVNLATRLVHDGHLKAFDQAIVISDDSDLCEAIRIVNQELKLRVVVINPYMHNNPKLAKVASAMHRISEQVLAQAQLPDTLRDAVGDFTKPVEW